MQLGADFSALIDRFSPNPKHPIALAVSGGSDSLALLVLCHRWAQTSGRKLSVFTVDHGLRAEAKTEAGTVAALCADLGIPHQTLNWADPKPTQAAARAARYTLLAGAVRDVSASCILTGHTLEDVVETALIRRRRGVRGPMQAGPALAAPLPVWPNGHGIAVLRPLVKTTREALRAYLTAANIDWVDDPSNSNPSFERVRVRQFLARHKNLAAIAVRKAKKLQIERARTDTALGEALADVRVNQHALIEADSAALSTRMASLLARCASGSDRDPRAVAVGEMLAGKTAPGLRQTLGGAWFQRTQSGFLIGRDPANVDGCTDRSVFDGRFVRDPSAKLPDQMAASFLVRHAQPPTPEWREVVSERLNHMRLCYQTPFYDCISV